MHAYISIQSGFLDGKWCNSDTSAMLVHRLLSLDLSGVCVGGGGGEGGSMVYVRAGVCMHVCMYVCTKW